MQKREDAKETRKHMNEMAQDRSFDKNPGSVTMQELAIENARNKNGSSVCHANRNSSHENSTKMQFNDQQHRRCND